VRIALSDVAFATAGTLGYIADAELNNAHRPHYGNDVFGAYGRDFVTRDGKRLMLVAITRGQWKALEQATGLGDRFDLAARALDLDFAREGDRYQGRAAITAILERWFAERDFAAVADALERAGVCWGPYQTFQEMLRNDPRVSTSNPLFQNVEQPGIGRYLMPGNPVDFGASPRGSVVRAPILGEHTDEILLGVLNLSERAVGELHDRGLVAGAVEP